VREISTNERHIRTLTKKKKKKKKGENEVQKFGKSRVSVKRILFRLRGCLSG
jgi:hypothetical protein